MKTIARRFSIGGVFVLVLLVAYFCMIPAVNAEKTFNWKWAHSMISSDPTFVEAQKAVKRISERSNGRLKIQLLASGQHPYKGSDILNVVRDGLAQLGETEDVYISATEPLLGPMMLPFFTGSMEDAYNILPKLRQQVFEPLLNEKYNSSVVMDFLIVGECVHANAFLDSFPALKGKKIRVWNKETSDLIKALGAVPVTVSYSELYSALQTGVIDGALTSMDGAWSANIYETVKYVTWWDFAFPWDFTVVNRDAYNELPEDLQKILSEEMEKSGEYIRKSGLNNATNILLKAMYKNGIKAMAIKPEFREEIQKRTKFIVNDWAERAGAGSKEVIEIVESIRSGAK